MNRDFFIDEITPALARRIVNVMRVSRMYVDPIILEKAKLDKIGGDGLKDELRQFIIDHDHRCLIPYQINPSEMREGIATSIPVDEKVIFFDEPIHWNRLVGDRLTPFDPENENRFQFLSKASILNVEASLMKNLIEVRDRLVIIKMNHPQQSDWLCRIFPKVIAYCEVSAQFSMFNRNDVNNSVLACAIALSPHLAVNAKRLNSMPLERSLPFIGGTSLFLRKEDSQGKKNK